jgi:hypothetical protein
MSGEQTRADRLAVLRTGATMTAPAFERRLLALASVLLSHFLLFIGGAVAATIVGRRPLGPMPGVPHEPLRVLLVALIMAHSSLAAIWWARTGWPTQVKTFAAALFCCALWFVLLLLLDSTRQNGRAAGAWAAALATQAAVVAIITVAIELATDYRQTASRFRYSIFFLMLWTTIVGVVLGGAAAWAKSAGWKLADVPSWEYFMQLQGVALVNAGLALAVHVAACRPPTVIAQAVLCAAVIVLMAAAAPATLRAIFGDQVGATMTDMVWLFAGEGLFLVATLLPLEIAAAKQERPLAARLSA